MRVRVSHPPLLRDLIAYLRAGECVAEQATADEIDVFLPRARNDANARRDLAIYLATWQAMNPGETAKLLDERDEPKPPEPV